MTELTEGRHAAAAILSEANGHISRKNVTLGASQTILACMLLGMLAVGDAGGGDQTVAAAVAFAGNSGTGAVGSLTADAHAPAGGYKLVCIEPATDAGKFEVLKPDGTVDGIATVGVAYNGTLNFTISDATDFIAGDGYTVNVSYADTDEAGQYVAFDQDGTDGSQTPVAMAIYATTTGADETKEIVVIDRMAELNTNVIEWPADIDEDEKAAAVAALADRDIIVR